jgi:perosamine synthetase
MNDITGAIGLSKLDRLEAETTKRREAAKKYDAILAKIPGLMAPKTTAGAEPVYHLYVARFDTAKFLCTRDQFCDALKAEGVPTAVHYPRPLTRQPAFAQFADKQPVAPVSETLCKQVFALPMHHGLSDEHFKTIGDALNKVSSAYRA